MVPVVRNCRLLSTHRQVPNPTVNLWRSRLQPILAARFWRPGSAKLAPVSHLVSTRLAPCSAGSCDGCVKLREPSGLLSTARLLQPFSCLLAPDLATRVHNSQQTPATQGPETRSRAGEQYLLGAPVLGPEHPTFHSLVAESRCRSPLPQRTDAGDKCGRPAGRLSARRLSRRFALGAHDTTTSSIT